MTEMDTIRVCLTIALIIIISIIRDYVYEGNDEEEAEEP